MHKSYKTIDAETANGIKMIMTDVDGTLLAAGRDVSPEVENALRLLQRTGIIVGLVSGRTLGELEMMALHLGLDGPIIAENGGVAKPSAGQQTFNLGYSRKAAEEAFRKLREIFPDTVQGREDNDQRTIDMVIRTKGISPEEIKKHIGSTQLLDSGYIMHLMQEGISKGRTLERLLDG
jgi:HAD superfamily hydrolase (TIGR01484 family)